MPWKNLYKQIIPLPLRIKIRDCYDTHDPKVSLWLAKVIYSLIRPKTLLRLIFPQPILFYPELPVKRYHTAYKICYLLGYRLTNDITKSYGVVFHWEDATVSAIDPALAQLARTKNVVNIKSTDIRKGYIHKAFQDVFGYSFEVDPLTFRGVCVQKSDKNSSHDGKVIQCPMARAEEGCVYQRLINNQADQEWVLDIRVPVLKEKIPLVYYKYRRVEDRFDHYLKAEIVMDVSKVFGQEELKKIILFSQRIGLDYGEFDILRDRDDGRLYIVDANNTPAILRSFLMSKKDFCRYMVSMADSFEKAFGAH